MLRAVSAISLENPTALELFAAAAARRDFGKLIRIKKYSSSAPNGQTVLRSEERRAEAAGSVPCGAPPRPGAELGAPPRPPPGLASAEPGAPRRAWALAAAALAAAASLGGVYFYRKLSDDGPKEATLEPAAGGAQPAREPPAAYPASGGLLPRHVQFLLVGGGTASFAAMRAIRAARPDAAVLLVGEEPLPPYMRPPLSKEVWREPELGASEEGLPQLSFRQWNGKRRPLLYEPLAFYTPVERLAECGGGAAAARGWRVTRLDVTRHEAELRAPGLDPVTLTYDKCLIATGEWAAAAAAGGAARGARGRARGGRAGRARRGAAGAAGGRAGRAARSARGRRLPRHRARRRARRETGGGGQGGDAGVPRGAAAGGCAAAVPGGGGGAPAARGGRAAGAGGGGGALARAARRRRGGGDAARRGRRRAHAARRRRRRVRGRRAGRGARARLGARAGGRGARGQRGAAGAPGRVGGRGRRQLVRPGAGPPPARAPRPRGRVRPARRREHGRRPAAPLRPPAHVLERPRSRPRLRGYRRGGLAAAHGGRLLGGGREGRGRGGGGGRGRRGGARGAPGLGGRAPLQARRGVLHARGPRRGRSAVEPVQPHARGASGAGARRVRGPVRGGQAVLAARGRLTRAANRLRRGKHARHRTSIRLAAFTSVFRCKYFREINNAALVEYLILLMNNPSRRILCVHAPGGGD